MAEHTPGPWLVDEVHGPLTIWTGNVDVPAIAHLVEQGDADDPGLWGSEYENARLIAAAPDLLEALKASADYLADIARSHHPAWTPEMCDKDSLLGFVYAAIARAEGR